MPGSSDSFYTVRRWYDGYTLDEIHSVYNPFSVISAIQNRKYKSYWKKTSASEPLLTYIDMNHEGLQDDIVKLINGETIEIDTDGFENDFATFRSKDDILTLLVHLGYLAYEERSDSFENSDGTEEVSGFVRIPNEEVRLEFKKILRKGKHEKRLNLVRLSDQLPQDTLDGQEAKVADGIAAVRDSEYSPGFYNKEQALRYVIKFAYISCVDQYCTAI